MLVATGKKRLLFTNGPMEAVDALAAVAPTPPAFAGPIDVTARFAIHFPGSRRCSPCGASATRRNNSFSIPT